jgi:hypothetical protein
LLIDLSVSVESDDPQGLIGIILESDAKEIGARLQIESKLRVSKAEAAVDAWGRYHEALTKYDPETADEGERKRLTELKHAAQELEREAEMGKRTHIGRQLQSRVPRLGGLDPSRVLGLGRDDNERRADEQKEDDTEDVIDLKTEKT